MLKHFRRVFLTALCICLTVGSALAVDVTVLPKWKDTEPVRTVQQMVSTGDVLYMTVRTDDDCQIWSWREQMPQAHPIAKGLTFTSSYTARDGVQALTQEGMDPDVHHAISCIFTDGKTLYAFNCLNGLVFTIDFRNGLTICEDVVTLKNTDAMHHDRDGVRYYYQPGSACVAGDYLIWQTDKWDSELRRTVYTVTAFDLRDGSAKTLKRTDIRQVNAYRDGMVLLSVPAWGDVQSYSVDAYDLLAYDPAKDAYFEAGTVMETIGAYDAEKDLLIRQSGMDILGKVDMGMPELYAMAPTRDLYRMAIVGDSVVMWKNQEMVARTLVRGYEPPAKLRVDGEESDADAIFREIYPSVNLEHAQDSSKPVDVVSFPAKSARDEAMRAGNELMDLSDSTIIREFVETLHPVFRDLAMQDGKIVAIPTTVTSNSGFYINRRVMGELGLLKDEVPSNYVDLCAFITRWNRTYAKTNPNFTVVEYAAPSYRSRILRLMLNAWEGHCTAANQPLHYDDPILREMLTALDAMEADRLDANNERDNPEDSDYMQGLIWDNCMLVGNFAAYMEDYSDRIFLPMTLTAQSPYEARIEELKMWGVRADTAYPKEAVALVEAQVQALTAKQRAVLCVNAEPEKNPEYPKMVERSERVLKDLEAMEWIYSDEVYWGVRRLIGLQEDFMSGEMLRAQYRVTPSALENYQKVVVPALYVTYNEITSEEMMMVHGGKSALQDLYAMRLIDMEVYISLADQFQTLKTELTAGVEHSADMYALCSELAAVRSSGKAGDYIPILQRDGLNDMRLDEMRDLLIELGEMSQGNG